MTDDATIASLARELVDAIDAYLDAHKSLPQWPVKASKAAKTFYKALDFKNAAELALRAAVKAEREEPKP